MRNIDLLPRLLPDKYCRTLEEARLEVARRRKSEFAGEVITRHVESRYGGYRVYSIPKEEFVEALVEPILPPVLNSRPRSPDRPAYR